MKITRKLLIRSMFSLSTLLILLNPVNMLAQDGAAAAVVGGGFLTIWFAFICCVLIFGIAILIAHIYCMIDLFLRDFGENEDQKWIWLIAQILLLFFGFSIVGVILHYFAVMRTKPKKN